MNALAELRAETERQRQRMLRAADACVAMATDLRDDLATQYDALLAAIPKPDFNNAGDSRQEAT